METTFALFHSVVSGALLEFVEMLSNIFFHNHLELCCFEILKCVFMFLENDFFGCRFLHFEFLQG